MRNLTEEEERELRQAYPLIVRTRHGYEWHLPHQANSRARHARTLCGKEWVSFDGFDDRWKDEHLCQQCVRSARVAAWKL